MKTAEEKEIWKDINGFEGVYIISNIGRIASLHGVRRGISDKPRILKGCHSKNGYILVALHNKNKIQYETIHRLVASHFIPNPDNKPEIDHINTIRSDNRVDNLRWVTRSENCRNPITQKRMSIRAKRTPKEVLLKRLPDFTGCENHPTQKKIIDIATGVIYKSVSAAARENGLKISTLSAMLIGQNPNRTKLTYYDE